MDANINFNPDDELKSFKGSVSWPLTFCKSRQLPALFAVAHIVTPDMKTRAALYLWINHLCVLAEWGNLSESHSLGGLIRCWRGGLRHIIKGPSEAFMFSQWFSTPPEICFSKVFDSEEERETWIAPCWSLVLLTRWHTDQSYVKNQQRALYPGFLLTC